MDARTLITDAAVGIVSTKVMDPVTVKLYEAESEDAKRRETVRGPGGAVWRLTGAGEQRLQLHQLGEPTDEVRGHWSDCHWCRCRPMATAAPISRPSRSTTPGQGGPATPGPVCLSARVKAGGRTTPPGHTRSRGGRVLPAPRRRAIPETI